jgi:quinol monooxygenase YgiN
MILVSFRMVIPAKKRKEVAGILRGTVERTLAEQGCMSCYFYSDVQDDRGLMLEEVWKTNDDLTHHLKSQVFRDVLLVAENALEAPEIRFSHVMPGNGMETIENARSGRK